jgi:hypothetical protein
VVAKVLPERGKLVLSLEAEKSTRWITAEPRLRIGAESLPLVQGPFAGRHASPPISRKRRRTAGSRFPDVQSEFAEQAGHSNSTIPLDSNGRVRARAAEAVLINHSLPRNYAACVFGTVERLASLGQKDQVVRLEFVLSDGAVEERSGFFAEMFWCFESVSSSSSFSKNSI